MKRVSLATSLIQNFDKSLKERILGANISKEALNRFREKEKKDSVKILTDLQDLKSKSESQVYEVLNTMVKNSQFFMYCGPLLLNINPGPNYIRDYLNLQSWIKETQDIDEQEWKPHLYTYMYYVYKILIEEKKDQVVNMLGQIGSGKTFNMIHIIEYFCCMVGPENKQMETFDIIHKSIQLVHIMGSIFRQNNLESTSCGILLRLGFGLNNKIANFDIEAKILDCTLPFSENGRSYSILHSFICAATSELKRNFFLPENAIHLNFFRKFGKNFSKKTKERFKLNDYEIWNRFHSLLKFFEFEKEEVIEILQIFSFMININELGMTKGEIGHMKGYMISKGQTSHRLATLLNMDEDNFIHQMGIFKDVQEIKNTLVSLMKYSYYIVFEFILFKIKKKLRNYFSEINPNLFQGNTTDDIKYINFLDFPGEVEDQTLGGLLTNLANECINLYAGSSYSSMVEKILKEKINLKLFRPLHSYYMLRTLMGHNGLFTFLSNAFTENNYNALKEICQSKPTFKKCIKFRENQFDSQQFKFDLHFSHTSVRYNYQSLYMETKTLVNVAKAYKIFSLSGNKIIKTVYPKVVPSKINFFNFTYNILQSLFKPIEGLSPFVIYCLHSNNSHKLFFGNENDEYLTEDEKNWVIPKKLTQDMLKRSLCIPVLYWIWFGYHEWIDIDVFLSEFEEDYIKIMEKQKQKEKEKENEKLLDKKSGNETPPLGTNRKEEDNVEFKDMKPFDKANIILNNILLGRDCVVGKNTILFKRGSIIRLRKKMNKLLGFNEKNKEIHHKTKLVPLLENYSTSNQNSKKNLTPNNHSLKTQCDLVYIQSKKDNIEIKEALPIKKGQKKSNKKDNNKHDKTNIEYRNNKKELELIELGEDDITKKYNMFNIMNKSRNNKTTLNESLSSNDDDDFDPFLNNKDKLNDKELAAFRKKNNIIIPSKNSFELVNSLFNYNKNTNFKIFDYSKVLPEILTIQCGFRCYQARQRHLLLKYLISRITMIQKTERGNITRKKYHRLKKCLELIIRIQSNFRKKLYFVLKRVILIQNWVRKFLAERKYERKKKRKENSLINPDEEYYDSTDEEEVKRVLIRKKKRERERKKENQRKMIENERKKKITEEAKINREKEIRRRKLKEKQKLLSMNMKERIKDNKNKANMFYSYFSDIEGNDLEKDKNSTLNKTKKYNIPMKKSKKDDIYDIEKEHDINKIIPALLLDKNLLKDNESMNRLLANENGVKKDIRYKLLQLENPVSKNIKRAPLENSKIYIASSNKSSKSNFSLSNINDQKKKGRRIEDKLLDYGKALKQKKAQERVDKLKAEDEECTFKPKLQKRIFKNNFFNTDFYTRAAKFEEKKEKDLDTIKSKINDDKNKEEYTFKPKISKHAKKKKRSIDDLYNWNKKKQEKIEEKQREKQKFEDEQFELNQQTTYVNNKSKILLSRKSRDSSKHNYNLNDVFDLNRNEDEENINEGEEYYNNYNNNNNNEIKFDLWPNYLERKFIDEKEEIPLPGIKEGEYNQLDFIGNKKEYNEEEEDEEEESNNNKIKLNDYNNINNININNNENVEENENEEDE